MDNIARYRELVDELRTLRSFPGWKPEDDRSILALLEDLYYKLSDDEQLQVEATKWRIGTDSK
jgi:hypothetical protein